MIFVKHSAHERFWTVCQQNAKKLIERFMFEYIKECRHILKSQIINGHQYGLSIFFRFE
jgi:hypothetical protein